MPLIDQSDTQVDPSPCHCDECLQEAADREIQATERDIQAAVNNLLFDNERPTVFDGEPEQVSISYDTTAEGYTPIISQREYARLYERSRQRWQAQTITFEPKSIPKHRIMPRKMNKLREWSISARALKSVIYCCANYGNYRYAYKFNSVWDTRYKLFRVWNGKTKNVVCTVKQIGDIVYIRYRDKSVYSPVLSSLHGVKLGKIVFKTLPSNNLGTRRGDVEIGIRYCNTTKEAQAALRLDMYSKAMKTKQMIKDGMGC